MSDAASTPGFLPRAEHLAYLANLLTVLGILYAVSIIWRKQRRTAKGQVVGGPGWSWGASA